MKFLTILTLVSAVTLASAAPCHENHHDHVPAHHDHYGGYRPTHGINYNQHSYDGEEEDEDYRPVHAHNHYKDYDGEDRDYNLNYEDNTNYDDNQNYEDNSNHENNSHQDNKEITQVVGSVGSNHGATTGGGLLSDLLGNGLLSSSTTNNYVSQNAKIHKDRD